MNEQAIIYNSEKTTSQEVYTGCWIIENITDFDRIAWVEQAFDCYIQNLKAVCYKKIWEDHKHAVIKQLRSMMK